MKRISLKDQRIDDFRRILQHRRNHIGRRKEDSCKSKKEKLPIVDKDFNLKGLITIKDIEKQIKYPLSAKDAQGRLLCGAAIGITANCLERAQALVDAKVDVVVLDSAHGHSANVLHTVDMIKSKFLICR